MAYKLFYKPDMKSKLSEKSDPDPNKVRRYGNIGSTIVSEKKSPKPTIARHPCRYGRYCESTYTEIHQWKAQCPETEPIGLISYGLLRKMFSF